MRTNIVFKEWAPDQPDLGAEVLVKALNVMASPSGYKHFPTLDSTGPVLTAGSIAGVFASGGATKFDNDIYVSDGTNYFVSLGGGFTARGSNTASSSIVNFTQFDDLIIAVGDAHTPKKQTLNSTSNFATLAASGTAPAASVVGVLNRFVVLGNLGTAGSTATSFPNAIQWSGIDNPTSWPTPNSTTAIAQQSGYQEFDSRWGQITGIHGGDQHGVVFQTNAVTRVTYVGPPVVFQFDLISNDFGSLYRRASIQAGPWYYFISKAGFCRTDGVNVERIGAGKVDRFFFDAFTGSESQMMVGYDPVNKLVCWAYPTSAGSASTCNRMISFNTDTSSWTYQDVNLESLVTPGGGTGSFAQRLMAFGPGSVNTLGFFQGTAGSAVIETSDTEINPGGRAFVDGFAPHVESSATAPAMTVRLGYRDDLGTAPTYTSATTVNSATGFANFRVDAKYHRAELTITGNFDRIPGAVVSGKPSGLR